MAVSVDQNNAISFALELEQREAAVCTPLMLRTGIATGEALLFEGDDYVGSAVNMAARLCDKAHDREVLMPAMHLDTLPEGIAAEPRGAVELRGFPGPIEVVRLTGVPVQTDPHDTGELWTRSPFI